MDRRRRAARLLCSHLDGAERNCPETGPEATRSCALWRRRRHRADRAGCDCISEVAMIDEAAPVPPDDGEEPGADDLSDIHGLITDIDTLEELVEELDDFGLTTRSQAAEALETLRDRAGERTVDDRIGRLEVLIDAMDEFEAASREDLVAKMAEYDAQVDDIESGEDSQES